MFGNSNLGDPGDSMQEIDEKANAESEGQAQASAKEAAAAPSATRRTRKRAFIEDQDANLEYAEYLESGVQIGAMVKAPGMSKFIYKTREDGLHLLDVKTIAGRVQIAAKMLARYAPEDIVVTASRVYAMAPAKKFAEVTGTKAILGRVMPGIFTNPNRSDYMEPAMVLVSDPRNERQAIKEASKINMPVIALADTDNWIKFVDLVVPCNNKGRHSLALIYYILAREFLKEKGRIRSNAEFKHKRSDFEAKIELKSK
ncbi:MAG: 30S ribosomal protein S2 [Candidatus Micrarchaeaceae archaeon]